MCPEQPFPVGSVVSRNPENSQTLVNVARALGVSTDELLGLQCSDTFEALKLHYQLPQDLREEFLSKLRKMVDDYQNT